MFSIEPRKKAVTYSVIILLISFGFWRSEETREEDKKNLRRHPTHDVTIVNFDLKIRYSFGN